VNRINRAKAYLYSNQGQAAQQLAQSAVDDAESVLAADTSDTRAMETVARAHWVLGSALAVRGNFEAAAVPSERAALLVDQLIDIDADRYQWIGPLLGSSRILVATIAAGTSNDLAECRAALEAMVPEAERLQALADDHQGDADLGAIAAHALMLKGDFAALSGDQDQMQVNWFRSAEVLKRTGPDLQSPDPVSRWVFEQVKQREREGAIAAEKVMCGR
jgi:hypothetical protein